MTNQSVATEIFFDQTTVNTSESHFYQRKLYQELAADLSISQKHISRSDNTTADEPNVKGFFPEQLPKLPAPRYSFSVLQEWEGYVVSITSENFTARLVDLTRNCSIEAEEADFPLDDLEDADRSRICPGAIFRWTIGYRRSPGGTKFRQSSIVFRDMPIWTKKEIEKNRLDAAEWASKLNDE